MYLFAYYSLLCIAWQMSSVAACEMKRLNRLLDLIIEMLHDTPQLLGFFLVLNCLQPSVGTPRRHGNTNQTDGLLTLEHPPLAIWGTVAREPALGMLLDKT